jgi:hypothetical protein
MRTVMRVGTMLVAFLLTALVGVGIASPAYAASCSGASCVHKEPQASGCGSDAKPVGSVRPAGGGPAVVLRWSAVCRANWARLEDGSEPGNYTFWVQSSDGHREDKLFNRAQWTFMVNGNLSARACIQNGFGQVSCTPWA